MREMGVRNAEVRGDKIQVRGAGALLLRGEERMGKMPPSLRGGLRSWKGMLGLLLLSC